MRQSILVAATQARTFAALTGRLAEWWPLDPLSYGGAARVRTVALDGRVGGEVIEHWHDGTVRSWGTVLVWEPPERLVMTWNVTPAATEVELCFRRIDADTTRVEVEHRGWERLSPEQLTAACAHPGGYAGGAFAQGWSSVLQALEEHLR